jgi:hypothetical protein
MRFLKPFPKDKNGLFIVYDRFTFDNLFRLLLKNGFDHDEARDFILANCSLSALVFQERLHNNGYLRLSGDDALDPKNAAHRAKVISDFLEIAINARKKRGKR